MQEVHQLLGTLSEHELELAWRLNIFDVSWRITEEFLPESLKQHFQSPLALGTSLSGSLPEESADTSTSGAAAATPAAATANPNYVPLLGPEPTGATSRLGTRKSIKYAATDKWTLLPDGRKFVNQQEVDKEVAQQDLPLSLAGKKDAPFRQWACKSRYHHSCTFGLKEVQSDDVDLPLQLMCISEHNHDDTGTHRIDDRVKNAVIGSRSTGVTVPPAKIFYQVALQVAWLIPFHFQQLCLA